MEPMPGIRIVIDKEITCNVINIKINKTHFKKTSRMYPTAWCDYSIPSRLLLPQFNGDTAWLTNPYEDYIYE